VDRSPGNSTPSNERIGLSAAIRVKTLEITDVLKLHMSFAAFCLRKAHCLCKNGEKLGLELGLMLALGMVVAQFSRSE